MKILKDPLTKNDIKNLKAGQEIAYSGILYTARDQAHQRIVNMLKHKKKLPFSLKNKLIYYCGPNPAQKGRVIGACGPTTSSRMDVFTPKLYENGILGTLGKGERSKEVIKAIKKYKGIYFVTYAGCGALLSEYVVNKRLVCFADLGTEAVFALEVKNFPLIVGIDTRGVNIYEYR
ncbi:MAG: FumA C-terminus/TtdB family hydratase beta subunit [Candidatus Omnitrophota bacterium]